jgi:hypothetical protein
MKKNIFPLTLFLKLFAHIPASALSVVYNFRIAQITRHRIADQTQEKSSSVSPLLFDLYQKSHAFGVRENYAGGLVTYNKEFAEKNYFRADFAVAHVNQTVKRCPKIDVIEPDDILLTMGRSFQFSQKSKATTSILFGIPTHSIYSLQRVGMGYGQVGLGIQLDGVYKFTKDVDFLWGSRYNYFIPQTALDATGKCYNFTIGSIADILVALQTNNPLGHGVEGGYSGRWGFGIEATPTIANIDRFNYMRNNFYLVYKYSFLTPRLAHRFLLNISYGSDAKPKCYGYNAVMVWGSWGIAF